MRYRLGGLYLKGLILGGGGGGLFSEFYGTLRDGAVKVYRGRVFLIDQDRAGKKSLKKSLIGLPFNPKESSTDGIEVDPSKFQLDVSEALNWQPIDESKQGLLPGCSTDVEKLCIPVSHYWQ